VLTGVPVVLGDANRGLGMIDTNGMTPRQLLETLNRYAGYPVTRENLAPARAWFDAVGAISSFQARLFNLKQVVKWTPEPNEAERSALKLLVSSANAERRRYERRARRAYRKAFGPKSYVPLLIMLRPTRLREC